MNIRAFLLKLLGPSGAASHYLSFPPQNQSLSISREQKSYLILRLQPPVKPPGFSFLLRADVLLDIPHMEGDENQRGRGQHLTGLRYMSERADFQNL